MLAHLTSGCLFSCTIITMQGLAVCMQHNAIQLLMTIVCTKDSNKWWGFRSHCTVLWGEWVPNNKVQQP